MANTADNDPEEDYKKSKSGDDSDEDFGLPEFEYEELSDDDDEDDESSSSEFSSSEDNSSFDSAVSDYTADTDDYNYDSSSENSYSAIDEIEDDEDIDLSTDSIDFSTDYNSENSDNEYFEDSQFSDDDFKDFEPSDNTDFMGSYRNPASETQGRGGFTKIIVFGVILFFLAAAGLLYWNSLIGDANTTSQVVKVEKTRPVATKKAEKESEPTKNEPEVVASNDQPAAEEAKQEPAKEEPKKEAPKKQEPKAQTPAKQPQTSTSPVSQASSGQIVRLQNATGRSYIIAGSFVDEDMAGDLCKKLISRGVANPMIIPPFNDTKFYRVAIADFATFPEAAQALAQYRETFGQDVWALRY